MNQLSENKLIDFNIYTAADMAEPVLFQYKLGEACLITQKNPERNSDNEDAILVASIADEALILAIADGAGGYRAGDRAAKIAVEVLKDKLSKPISSNSYRSTILDAFESAHANIISMGLGAATTFSVAEIRDRSVRFYHVGDSPMLLVGQKAKLKMQNQPHSPVGYAVAAGVLDNRQALASEDSHIVSNLLGLEGMYIELSSPAPIACKDTLLVASDGLSDNVYQEKIIDMVRIGDLADSVDSLAKFCQQQMRNTNIKSSHPDDMSMILFRPRDI